MNLSWLQRFMSGMPALTPMSRQESSEEQDPGDFKNRVSFFFFFY